MDTNKAMDYADYARFEKKYKKLFFLCLIPLITISLTLIVTLFSSNFKSTSHMYIYFCTNGFIVITLFSLTINSLLSYKKYKRKIKELMVDKRVGRIEKFNPMDIIETQGIAGELIGNTGYAGSDKGCDCGDKCDTNPNPCNDIKIKGEAVSQGPIEFADDFMKDVENKKPDYEIKISDNLTYSETLRIGERLMLITSLAMLVTQKSNNEFIATAYNRNENNYKYRMFRRSDDILVFKVHKE